MRKTPSSSSSPVHVSVSDEVLVKMSGSQSLLSEMSACTPLKSSVETLDASVWGSSRLMKVATCNLNQWALDFDGNLSRIMESIRQAKAAGCTLRVGPELEITGYGCEDHFHEADTIMHSWQSLHSIITSKITDGILCALGMPIMHEAAVYNCCVWLLNSRIVLIRPKAVMSDEENYRETRYFTAWVKHKLADKKNTLEAFKLPPLIQRVTGQRTVPLGVAIIDTLDTRIANETCEEMFIPKRSLFDLALCGVEVVCNQSGSLHQARKLQRRIELITGGTRMCGGVYLYANQQGCDGGRLYYDGCAMISCCGDLLAQASQFSLSDVELVTATVDLAKTDALRRTRPSFMFQSARASSIPVLAVDFHCCISAVSSAPSGLSLSDGAIGSKKSAELAEMKSGKKLDLDFDAVSRMRAKLSRPLEPVLLSIEEEIAQGPACWLWDYLRRVNGCAGFFLPLSGGADSSSTATIVYSMCCLVVKAIVEDRDKQVLIDARRIVGVEKPQVLPSGWRTATLLPVVDGGGEDDDEEEEADAVIGDGESAQLRDAKKSGSGDAKEKEEEEVEEEKEKCVDSYIPTDPKEFCHRIFHTCYMGTEKNSSQATRARAKGFAEAIGAFHYDTNIDTIVEALVALFSKITGKTPRFRAFGGTHAENLALQNIQARLRMVLSYFLAQLLPWIRGNSGFLLVLGASNVDEALRGYMTKYDCSAADINPIGGICKGDLKAFLRYAADKFDIEILKEVCVAPPTAELEPLSADYTQNDEDDMGMTYAELGTYGFLRKVSKCGPVSMYERLVVEWTHLTPFEVAEKVKRFFKYYAINRHKLTILTPSLHFQHYSPDDNRFDHRQFLYPPFARQFAVIDAMVKKDTAFRSESPVTRGRE